MDQEPTIKDERDFTNQSESQENSLEMKGAEMLENPANGEFVAGLRAFIIWVKSLLAKKD